MSQSIDLADLVPGLPAVYTARARITAHRKTMTPPPSDHDALAQLANELARAAEAGDPLPVDLAETIAGRRAAMATYAEAVAALNMADQMLTDRAQELTRAGADKGLAALAARLGELLAAVRDIAPALGGVRTAEDAMSAGEQARNAYPIARDLLRQYEALRAAQRQLTRAGWPGDVLSPHDVLRFAGDIANVDEVWPCWPRALTGNGYLDKATNTMTTPPWPDDADPFTGRYSLAYLLWAADPATTARVWLPTVPELRDAYDRMHAAVGRRERAAEQAAGLGGQHTEYMPSIG